MKGWIGKSFRNRIFVTMLLSIMLPVLLCGALLLRLQVVRSERNLAQQAQERNAEFITLFYGENVTVEQAQAAHELFASRCPDAELSVLPGGQPVYYYIVSIE